MDIWGVDTPRFHIHGMAGTPRHQINRYDLYTPFFHAILSFARATQAFGDEELCATLSACNCEFDRLSGRNEAYPNASVHPPYCG